MTLAGNCSTDSFMQSSPFVAEPSLPFTLLAFFAPPSLQQAVTCVYLAC